MGTRHGYEFEREIQQSLARMPSVWAMKLIDTRMAQSKCIHCGNPVSGIIIPKQPADFLCVRHGKATFIECKSTRNSVSFDLNLIKPHQLQAGINLERKGAKYWFLLCRRIPYQMGVWALRPNHILLIRKNMTTKGAVKWPVIQGYALNGGRKIKRDTKRGLWTGLSVLFR